MQSGQDGFELNNYLRLLFRWWWVLLIAPAITAGVTYYHANSQTPLYIATTEVLVQQARSGLIGPANLNANQELVGSWTYETGVTIASKGSMDMNKTFATTVGTGLIGTNNTRNIVLWVKKAQAVSLDVDGNGEADALTDGILIMRYLYGFQGQALIDGV